MQLCIIPAPKHQSIKMCGIPIDFRNVYIIVNCRLLVYHSKHGKQDLRSSDVKIWPRCVDKTIICFLNHMFHKTMENEPKWPLHCQSFKDAYKSRIFRWFSYVQVNFIILLYLFSDSSWSSLCCKILIFLK